MARYQILPQRSRLAAEARSTLHPIRVDTAGLEGSLEAVVAGGGLDPDVAPTAVVEITVDLMRTATRLYDREIERRLESRKYPRVVGTVKRIQRTSAPNRYVIDAELRLHGVTRSVDTEVDVRQRDERTLEIEGEHVFDVRDFGLDPPKILLLKVHPQVRVRCVVVAQREEE